MAVLVFYGGAGINIISYCCNECRSKGIEALQNHQCCEIHHQHNNINLDNDENEYYVFNDDHSFGDCNLERIHFDWSLSKLSKQEKDFSPEYFTLITCNLFYDSLSDHISSGENFTPGPHGPPIVLPRDYLSILTVLLI